MFCNAIKFESLDASGKIVGLVIIDTVSSNGNLKMKTTAIDVFVRGPINRLRKMWSSVKFLVGCIHDALRKHSGIASYNVTLCPVCKLSNITESLIYEFPPKIIQTTDENSENPFQILVTGDEFKEQEYDTNDLFKILKSHAVLCESGNHECPIIFLQDPKEYFNKTENNKLLKIRVFKDQFVDSRCFVRIGIYNKELEQLVHIFSGCIISEDGYILTCAHSLIHPITRKSFPYNPNIENTEYFNPNDCTIVIGITEIVSNTPRWSHFASLHKIHEKLSNPKFPFIDLAILKIDGLASIISPFSTTNENIKFRFSPTNRYKFQFLNICKSTNGPQVGDLVCSIGYPAELDQTIFFAEANLEVADNMRVNSLTNTSLTQNLVAQLYNTYGSSGSPMLNSNKEIIGVMSKSDKIAYYCDVHKYWSSLNNSKIIS